MALTMTKEEREAFLADVHVAVVSVVEDGHGPLVVPIWYSYEPGGEVGGVFVRMRPERWLTVDYAKHDAWEPASPADMAHLTAAPVRAELRHPRTVSPKAS